MKKINYILIFSCFALQLNAQINKVQMDGLYPYIVYLPEGYADSTSNFPLILFLHGRSLCGTNLEKVDDYGPIYEIKRGFKVPFIIIAPQTPCGKMWEPLRLNKLLDAVIPFYKIDTNRMYVWGMSMGGYGTFHYTGKYAYRFAAAIAMCGGGDTMDAPNMLDLPLWVIHGTADRIVPISESVKMVEAIKKAGGEQVIFTAVKGWDHGAPYVCFREKEKYDWLLKHSRRN